MGLTSIPFLSKRSGRSLPHLSERGRRVLTAEKLSEDDRSSDVLAVHDRTSR